MNEAYQIEQLCLLPPEDILAVPENYADPNFDVPLVRVITKGLEDNPTLIMLGVDVQRKKKRYYLVVEDNDMSEDHYLDNDDNRDLPTMYKELVQLVLAMDQEWLHGGSQDG